MERTWSGTLSRSAPGSPRRPPKMAMCETEKRRMTHPMTVCRGSVLPQNAHEDCTTHHVRRMTARRLPDSDPALGGRTRHEKVPSWPVGGFMDDWEALYTHECDPSAHNTLGMWLDRLCHSQISVRWFSPVTLWTPVLKHNWIWHLVNPSEFIVCGANECIIYIYIRGVN